jgi:hypothetical protein
MELQLRSADGMRILEDWTQAVGIPPDWRLAIERGCIIIARGVTAGSGHLPFTGYHYHKHGDGAGEHAGWHEHDRDNDHASELHTHPHPATAQAAPIDVTSSPSAADVLPSPQPPGDTPANDYNAYDPTSV